VETPAIPSADAAHRETWEARERRTKMEMARTVLLFFILMMRWTGHQKQFISSESLMRRSVPRDSLLITPAVCRVVAAAAANAKIRQATDLARRHLIPLCPFFLDGRHS